MRFLFAIVLGCVLSSQAVVATAADDLAKQAERILRDKCADCHAGGAAEGRMNYVLNARRLISKGKVIPQDPARSKLFKEIESGRMPKDGNKLTAAEIDTLKQWITAGATPFQETEEVEFIAPEQIMLAIVNDLSRKDLDADDRRFQRYFTLTHLYNAGLSSDELLTYKQALFKLINSLSWEAQMHVPQPIDKQETIFRIDLRKLQWNEKTWEAILKSNPYGITHTGKTARDCYAYTDCSLPYVRGDWFVFAAARPPLYHVILDLPDPKEFPDTAGELERRLRVNVNENIRTRQVIRNGFGESGVSAHNRMFEWHRCALTHGAYIKSYDFKGSDGPKSLLEHPTGPGGQNGFEHDGGEIIFSLPNGLQAYLLVDAKGKRIDVGPTDVVLDKEAVKRGLQAEVINGISCIGCHKNGMIRKDDEIRSYVTLNPNAFNDKEAKLIQALYAPRDQWDKLFAEGEDRFRTAVHQALGEPESEWKTDLSPTEQITSLSAMFQDALDLDLAAAESGMQTQDMLDGLARDADLARKLGALRTPGGTVKREVFVATFPLLAKKLDLGNLVVTDPNFRPILPGTGSTPSTPPLPTIAPFDAAHAKAHQQALADYLGVQVESSNSLGMKFVLIPPGEFMMGSPTSEAGREGNEAPHQVTLTQPFGLSIYEVTQEQYQKVMRTNPSRFKGPKNPVEMVSWSDSVEFCVRLSALAGEKAAGYVYRLPTEAEWEYACRAGTATKYSFGDNDAQLANYAWYNLNSRKASHPVGQKRPNPWGLYDMHGNVGEWCNDWYGDYPSGPITDPTGILSGTKRAYRGGCWSYFSVGCRSALRTMNTPDYLLSDHGFRVLRSAVK